MSTARPGQQTQLPHCVNRPPHTKGARARLRKQGEPGSQASALTEPACAHAPRTPSVPRSHSTARPSCPPVTPSAACSAGSSTASTLPLCPASAPVTCEGAPTFRVSQFTYARTTAASALCRNASPAAAQHMQECRVLPTTGSRALALESETTQAEPSSAPVTANAPVGASASAVMGAAWYGCPATVAVHSPLRGFHTRSDASALAVTTARPSGVNAPQLTAPPWP